MVEGLRPSKTPYRYVSPLFGFSFYLGDVHKGERKFTNLFSAILCFLLEFVEFG